MSQAAKDLETLIVQAMREDTLPQLCELLTSGKYANPCFVNALHGEPLFVLRAQDTTAPFFVEAWAEQYRRKHARYDTDRCAFVWPEGSESKQEKFRTALALARAMTNWPTRKVPD